MPIKDDGIWFIGATWAMTVLVSLFVIIRLYTRVILTSWLGWDDYAYILAFLFLVAFSVIMTISSHYGFGQRVIPNLDDKANAHFYEGIGINLISSGMIIAKCSLGFFLLRIVQDPWQKASIWGVNMLLIAASMACCIVYWTQCTPVALIWDERVKGKCGIQFVPAAFTVTSVCVVADFFFAIFPWVVLWNVKMDKKDKALILTSLSVGVIAGVFGIKRTTEIGKLADREYFLEATVPAAIWSVAEIVVTMICIGVPVCLPFFRMAHGKWTKKGPNSVSGNVSMVRPQPNEALKPSGEGAGGLVHNGCVATVGAARKRVPVWDDLEAHSEFGDNYGENDEEKLMSDRGEVRGKKVHILQPANIPK